ncbi:MAG: hypothetical protein AVDCRST_MAG85-1596 [uncultured Solirubrobacteraceae bacterium]|uniref:HPr kinase/phosphorylase C-terminal domain-containing protein n=1 Tax=uncultured Solirubrobacteraceae bacterium TaxID=1162706 RepID=A0A6J4SH08_9ACTN|nr:MAG: hypothetical protein AVDCRST_MAG85-1596 [uncultured Solirubrobacteraceae bacterium]
MHVDHPRRGAYGLCVTGLDAENQLLADADPHWPTLRVVVDPRPEDAAATLLDETRACYPDAPGGYVEVDRKAGVATFRGVQGLTSDALVHPRLGVLAALYAYWLPGRAAFHAGAFVTGSRAWAVIGGRGDGKSSLMAALAGSGLPVLGDDTLVIDDLTCLPGVRCVDLRPDAASHLPAGRTAVPVRAGARRRMQLDTAPSHTTLSGWIFLRWGTGVELRPMPVGERVTRIAQARGWHRRGVTEPRALLELAGLPAWELTRPRDWTQLGPTVDAVSELLAGVTA